MKHLIKAKNVKPGDIIGFSGRYLSSDFINIATYGIPRWGLSHVGIMGNSPDGRLLLFESREWVGAPCEILGKAATGVQAHRLNDVVRAYRGRIWLYRLHRPLYHHENLRLCAFMAHVLGNPYDSPGAIRSGGIIYSLANAFLRRQNLKEFFCSELVAGAASDVGVFTTTNASRWSPNKLMRRLRREGISCPPERIK